MMFRPGPTVFQVKVYFFFFFFFFLSLRFPFTESLRLKCVFMQRYVLMSGADSETTVNCNLLTCIGRLHDRMFHLIFSRYSPRV